MATAEPQDSLTVRECWASLASIPVGRLVYTEHALPAIRPVNFSLHDGHVVVWSRPGGKAKALRDRVATFEADEIDTATGAGRSVVVTGIVSVVSDENESLSHVEPDRRPWVGGHLGHVLRVRVERLTGRRFTLPRRALPAATPPLVTGTDRVALHDLDAPTSWALLRTAPVGRLVYSERTLPAIVLADFTVDDDEILARPLPGSAVEVTDGDIVAFEADQLDPVSRTGWSVVVLGRAELTAGPDRRIRVRAERITGRQVLLGRTPTASI